jgi:hypothetical protein
MRNLAAYLGASILVVLAWDYIAPPVGFGLAVSALPAVDQGPVVQTVIRIHKSDRLSMPATIDKQKVPRKSPTMLVGCDPVFSPLSASAQANFSGRCIA